MNNSNSNSVTQDNALFSPVMATIYGLLITLVLRAVISVIAGTIVAETSGVDFDDANAINAVLASSLTFLLTELVLTAVLMIWAGRVIRRYSEPMQMKIGLLVTVITIAVYFALDYTSGSLVSYPFWFNACFYTIVVAGIIAGCKRSN